MSQYTTSSTNDDPKKSSQYSALVIDPYTGTLRLTSKEYVLTPEQIEFSKTLHEEVKQRGNKIGPFHWSCGEFVKKDSSISKP